MAYLGEPGLPQPPDGLVPLSSVPRNTWIGRMVWHPMSQDGGGPYWRARDEPESLCDPEDPLDEWCYDTGVVTQIVPDDAPYANHPDDPPRVHFKDISDDGNWLGLHYGAHNLWIRPSAATPPEAPDATTGESGG